MRSWLHSKYEPVYAILVLIDQTRPRGYKTFIVLNSTEHEISTAHKTNVLINKDFSCFQTPRSCISC